MSRHFVTCLVSIQLVLIFKFKLKNIQNIFFESVAQVSVWRLKNSPDFTTWPGAACAFSSKNVNKLTHESEVYFFQYRLLVFI